jgi:hypothetical protein
MMRRVPVAEVLSPDGWLVVRADPRGVPTRLFLLHNWGYLVAHLRRRAHRDRGWTITVRRRRDDPFGPAMFTLDVETKAVLRDAMAEVIAMAQRGQLRYRSPHAHGDV